MHSYWPNFFVNVSVLAAMAAVALAMIKIRDLRAVTMLSSVYSLLTATFFMTLDAVDVAFTEAAVGAGLTTILLLATIVHTNAREKSGSNHPWAGLAVVLLTGAMLVYGSTGLPAFGDPQAPLQNEIYQEYTHGSVHKLHIPNMVTSVLASYRGYDTMGEVAVIFTAGIAVALLLALGTAIKNQPVSASPSTTHADNNSGSNAGSNAAPQDSQSLASNGADNSAAAANSLAENSLAEGPLPKSSLPEHTAPASTANEKNAAS